MTNEQTATTTATQMQQVKAKQDKGKESREWGKERGAKNLPCKAMRSHVNQRTLAQRMQQSSSRAILAEAAQLA